MLFRRRTPPTRAERLRVAVWPRESWSRSARYFGKRVLRLSASPHAVAAGFAAGVAVSWTPLFGFHFLMAVALGFVLGGNAVAALIGTAVGNPLTFPFMGFSAYSLGRRLLDLGPGGSGLPPDVGGHARFEDILHAWEHSGWEHFLHLVKPWLVGAVPLGIASGLLAYVIVRLAVRAYQASRRQRLAARREVTAGPPLSGP